MQLEAAAAGEQRPCAAALCASAAVTSRSVQPGGERMLNTLLIPLLIPLLPLPPVLPLPLPKQAASIRTFRIPELFERFS